MSCTDLLQVCRGRQSGALAAQPAVPGRGGAPAAATRAPARAGGVQPLARFFLQPRAVPVCSRLGRPFGNLPAVPSQGLADLELN